ncbi:MAG: hypothetical protein KA142_02845 [Chromatiaceae bacterium]|nr:hypothetical protein [Chromatiaceae bacterium]
MIYHIANNAILSGPFSERDPYVIRLTRCGTPEVLDLLSYGLVPEIKPPLGEYQSYGEPIVSAEAVTFPVVDWSAEAIAEYEAQARANRPAQMVCSRAQGKLALLQADLLDTVESWVSTQPRATQIEYAERGEWRRDWPLVVNAGTAMGLTDSQLDDLFTLAPTL